MDLADRFHLALLPIGPRSFGTAGGPRVADVKELLDRLNKDARRLAETLLKLQHEAESGEPSADRALYLTLQHCGERIHMVYPELWRAIAPKEYFADFPEEWREDTPGQLSLNRFPQRPPPTRISRRNARSARRYWTTSRTARSKPPISVRTEAEKSEQAEND